jgi:hypothetical protein
VIVASLRTRVVVPLNEIALPYRPVLVQVGLVAVAFVLFEELSFIVVPVFSLKL